VLQQAFGQLLLRVRHGGGEETAELGYRHKHVAEALRVLDSDTRFLLLHQILRVHQKARATGVEQTTERYHRAFAEGRLKKRKRRGTTEVKVWIE
jgi:hypothetical protein